MQALVVAAGDPDPRDVVLLDSSGLLIAVDRGAVWLSANGRVPDRLVGDLDSVPAALLRELEDAGVPIDRHPTAKDASDTELAVDAAVEAGADRVVIIGALGGARLDHEVANLLLLASRRWLGRGVDLRIVRGDTTARAMAGGESRQLSGVVGDLVTLLPLGGDVIGIDTVGLAYPLIGGTLEMGRSRGVSNRIVEAPASVSIAAGTMLVIELHGEERDA